MLQINNAPVKKKGIPFDGWIYFKLIWSKKPVID